MFPSVPLIASIHLSDFDTNDAVPGRLDVSHHTRQVARTGLMVRVAPLRGSHLPCQCQTWSFGKDLLGVRIGQGSCVPSRGTSGERGIPGARIHRRSVCEENGGTHRSVRSGSRCPPHDDRVGTGVASPRRDRGHRESGPVPLNDPVCRLRGRKIALRRPGNELIGPPPF